MQVPNNSVLPEVLDRVTQAPYTKLIPRSRRVVEGACAEARGTLRFVTFRYLFYANKPWDYSGDGMPV